MINEQRVHKVSFEDGCCEPAPGSSLCVKQREREIERETDRQTAGCDF